MWLVINFVLIRLHSLKNTMPYIYFVRLHKLSELIRIFACPTLILLFVEGVVGAHIYIKGVTVRFGFDCVRTSQLQTVCQKQSNGNASWDVYIQPSLVVCVYDHQGKIIYSSAWGFRRCSFRQTWQCEGLNTVERVTELAPRFFFVYMPE